MIKLIYGFCTATSVLGMEAIMKYFLRVVVLAAIIVFLQPICLVVKADDLPTKYNFESNAQDSSGQMESATCIGDSITLPANTFERNGYFFYGWNTNADGSGEWIKDCEKI